MSSTILRLPAVKARTGLSRSSIYLKVSKDEFPKPIKLGIHSVGWLESDVEAWILERVNAGRKAA